MVSDQAANRKQRGKTRGPPPAFDREDYRARHAGRVRNQPAQAQPCGRHQVYDPPELFSDNTFMVVQPDEDDPVWWFTSAPVLDEGGYLDCPQRRARGHHLDQYQRHRPQFPRTANQPGHLLLRHGLLERDGPDRCSEGELLASIRLR
ncbi:hypothetical protein GCM10022206_57670 [Streptomyces chiangmaiensis]